MKRLSEDLLIYEIILLGLGIVLFFISIFIIYTNKEFHLKKLLIFLPLSIIMIVYPTIKGIEISGDRIKISKNTEIIIEDCNDSLALFKTAKALENLEYRAKTSNDFITISKSNLLLGNEGKAIVYAEKALKQDPHNIVASDLLKLGKFKEIAHANDSIALQQINQITVIPELQHIKHYVKQQYESK